MEVSRPRAQVDQYLGEAERMLDEIRDQLDPFIDELYRAYMEARTVFLVGNGGSAANASHFCQDLCKGTLPDLSATKRFRAVALTDNVSLITALANDHGYESVFVQQLMTLGQRGDVLVAISASGNSPNVLRVAEYAMANGITTIGVTGLAGGRLRQIADINVNIPSDDVGLVEALHSLVFHFAVSELRERVAPQSRPGGR